METRALTRLSVEPGQAGVLALAAALPDALNGIGSALAPIPTGPDKYVERVLAAVKPDDPRSPLESDDVAVVVTTSGSMGEPRGVLLPASALTAAARASDEFLGGPALWVVALPIHHIAGLQVLVRSYLAGREAVALDSIDGGGRFSAEEFAATSHVAHALADSDGCPLRTAIVPTQLARILALGNVGIDALREYETVLVGGAAAPSSLLGQAAKVGVNVVATYGMTETSGGCIYNGKPLSGVTVSITDPDERGVGRIELSGPMVARGYRLRPELTESAFGPGVHRTSDVGRMREGKLVVCGRLDDVVHVGGVNVSIAAVESRIRQLPGVADAAAVAIPDEQWGAHVAAFVVPIGAHGAAPGEVGTDLRESIKTGVAGALGAEARPRTVIVLDTLPTLPTGKVDREHLRRLAQQPAPPDRPPAR